MSDSGSQQRPSRVAVILGALLQFEKILAIAAFGILVVVIFGDVVSREFSGAGLYWASQTGVWANVFVVMAGFGLATADGMHLRPRFADNWLPANWSPVLESLQHALMALFCLLIGLLAARVVLGSYQLGEVSIELYLPIWPVQIMLPIAFFVGALRHAIYALYVDLRPTESNAMVMATNDYSGESQA
jgi:TRAP-type C4-dicarboxylate transport system permease small subunit